MEKVVRESAETAKQIAEHDDEIFFNRDSSHFRRVLPDIVWRLVTNKLAECPDTVTKFANSSPFFRHHSSSQRTHFLFGNVFPQMAERLSEIDGPNGMPISCMLNCREVSSHWNRVVDQHLKGQIFTQNIFHPNTDQVFEFLSHFEATHGTKGSTRNPFVSTILKVVNGNPENGPEEEEREHLNAVSLALRKYGHFISDFKLEVIGAGFYVEDAIKLQEWLATMPNLNSLNLTNNTRRLEGEMSLAEFQEQLIAANFPPFTKLIHLKIVKFVRGRAPVVNPFMQQNDHISGLELRECDDEYDFFNLELPNLVILEITMDSIQLFEKFRSSSHVSWMTVKYLNIAFRLSWRPDYFVPFADILSVVQAKFGTSLKRIYLLFPKAATAEEAESVWMDSVNCRLNLPSLMEVDFVLTDPISLDFLLEMKDTLKNIQLTIGYPISDELQNRTPSSIVQLAGFEKKITTSNIPVVFTNLHIFGIKVGHHDTMKYYCLKKKHVKFAINQPKLK